MNLALIDDLEYDLRDLQEMLLEFCSQQHISPQISLFSSGKPFLDIFRPGKFDAIFLDNVMDGLSGMEVAHSIRRQDASIPIIFITTEESYALEGYTVQAMDYIIKPISQERLYSVMNRLNQIQNNRHIIKIKENRMTRLLYLEDVLYVQSTGHFLEIQTTTGTLKPYMTIDYFLSLLKNLGEYGEPSQGLRFQNCCRGYVVSLDHVRSFDSSNFTMSDGSSVPISRPKYKEMQIAYANYLFRQTRNITD